MIAIERKVRLEEDGLSTLTIQIDKSDIFSTI